MHRKLAQGLALATLGTALMLPTTASAEVTHGAVLASTCFSCHGTDGNSPGNMPHISGLSADRMVQIMRDFSDERRPATVMNRHAKGYSDEEMQLIAEYLSTR